MISVTQLNLRCGHASFVGNIAMSAGETSYGIDVDLSVIHARWLMRSLLAVRWLVEHGEKNTAHDNHRSLDRGGVRDSLITNREQPTLERGRTQRHLDPQELRTVPEREPAGHLGL
jgi:hypothetical protein